MLLFNYIIINYIISLLYYNYKLLAFILFTFMFILSNSWGCAVYGAQGLLGTGGVPGPGEIG